MITYLAEYYKTFRFGGYSRIWSVVIANTESEALGLLLDKYPNTEAKYWDSEIIDTSEKGVIDVCEDEQ